jgi:hypothetical protein
MIARQAGSADCLGMTDVQELLWFPSIDPVAEAAENSPLRQRRMFRDGLESR